MMIANLIDALKYRNGSGQKKDDKSFTKSSRVTERVKQGRHE